MRVVSLLPSATEICYALGVEPVGVSHECDYPPAARSKPAVNDVRIDPDTDSETINEQVATAEQNGGIYEIDADLLTALDPDLVITQGLCDVCAVDTVLVSDVLRTRGIDADVLTTDPHTLADLYEEIRAIGHATNSEDAAIDLVSDLQSRVQTLDQRASALSERPSVAVFDWMDPVMVAGHWVPELVDVAGGSYPLVEEGERSRPWEWAEIRAADPDVLVAAPCGFELDQTREHRRALSERPGWETLSAVRSDRVFVMDGHNYVNRPGPRLVETAEHLAGLLHPEAFPTPQGDVARPFAPVQPE